jgi:excisionase family DNA binding protein
MRVELIVTDKQLELIARRAADLVDDRERSPDGFLDAAAAAAFLACPRSRVYALVSAKRIPHHRDGSRLLFDRAELRAWVRAGGAKRP